MLFRFYKKNEMIFVILLIVFYIVINSYCLNNFGLTDYRSFIVNLLFSLVIVIFIIKNKLGKYYGLSSFPSFKKYLYFVPLILIISVNIWNGFNVNNTFLEIIFFMLSMICVGFLEEIIFRGFLFKMMANDNIKSAVIVSSLTFGIGHIINLFHGVLLIPTILQIISAIFIGYLFAVTFIKSNSLWPCIITHALINAFSIFCVESTTFLYVSSIFLIVISILYSSYLNRYVK